MEDEREQQQQEQAPVEGAEEPIKRERPAPVPVTVLGQKGGSALVEWITAGVPFRGYVPASAVKPDGVSAGTLGKAVPYGIPWQTLHMPGGEDVAETLAVELRRRGIWTAEDLARGQKIAQGAIQAVAQIHLGRLNEFAHKNK